MSYRHFSLVERSKIELMVSQGKTRSEMARELGRHPTSIGREIRRNSTSQGYAAQRAQSRYHARRKACRPQPRLSYGPLRKYVIDKIAEEEWTPELVAGRLAVDYPEDTRMRVSHETLYQAIYRKHYHLDFLQEFLPQARPKRRPRGQGKKRRGPCIPNRVGIEQRPAAANRRAEIGHWEGDLVVGKQQDGFILTLVERVSRLVHMVKTGSKRASEVCQAVIEALLDRPVSWVKSITFDNGTEFRDHETISESLPVSVYFADPYSAYQRGSNEQLNGLLRRFLPKGTSFKALPQDSLDRLVDQLNNRPRKCLAYRTPNEVFQKLRQLHLRALSA